MTPIEALIHDPCLSGLPEVLAVAHSAFQPTCFSAHEGHLSVSFCTHGALPSVNALGHVFGALKHCSCSCYCRRMGPTSPLQLSSHKPQVPQTKGRKTKTDCRWGVLACISYLYIHAYIHICIYIHTYIHICMYLYMPMHIFMDSNCG